MDRYLDQYLLLRHFYQTSNIMDPTNTPTPTPPPEPPQPPQTAAEPFTMVEITSPIEWGTFVFGDPGVSPPPAGAPGGSLAPGHAIPVDSTQSLYASMAGAYPVQLLSPRAFSGAATSPSRGQRNSAYQPVVSDDKPQHLGLDLEGAEEILTARRHLVLVTEELLNYFRKPTPQIVVYSVPAGIYQGQRGALAFWIMTPETLGRLEDIVSKRHGRSLHDVFETYIGEPDVYDREIVVPFDFGNLSAEGERVVTQVRVPISP